MNPKSPDTTPPPARPISLARSDRSELADRVGVLLGMVDRAVVGYGPFFDVKLVVFPEFAHAAPDLRDRRRACREARRADPQRPDRPLPRRRRRNAASIIQTGTFLEVDQTMARPGLQHDLPDRPRWPPLEISEGEPLDSLGKSTPARRTSPGMTSRFSPSSRPRSAASARRSATIGCFPEAIRELALNGAEVLIRVSAYMDPWGATPPMDWWTLFNRARAVENFAFVVAANQGASASNYPPFSWPGGSMIVDYRRPDPLAGRPRSRRKDRRRPDRPRRLACRAESPGRPSPP